MNEWTETDTEEVVERIKQEEGFMPKVYLDSRGFKTIGYGTLLEDGITREEAEWLLKYRLETMIREIIYSSEGDTFQAMPNGIKKSLIDMAYNLGVPRLLKFKRMWAALRVSAWNEAAYECLDSNYAKQVPKRAQLNADIIRAGM